MPELPRYSQEDLLQLLEDLQTENETLWQKNQEQQQTILKLEQTAHYLTEKIETLSESDKQLKLLRKEKRNLEEKKQELENEASNMVDLVYKAKDIKREADHLLLEANEKKKNVEQYIAKRVAKESKIIQRKSDSLRQKSVRKIKDFYSVFLYVESGYAGVLTFLWLFNERQIFQTFPQWFVSRWETIKVAGHMIQMFFFWIQDLVPKDWFALVRFFIPLFIVSALVSGVGFMLWKVMISVRTWYRGIWRRYKKPTERRLKKAIMLSITSISLVGSLFLARIFPNSWHFFSYFLLFSLSGNLFYHWLGRNHWE